MTVAFVDRESMAKSNLVLALEWRGQATIKLAYVTHNGTEAERLSAQHNVSRALAHFDGMKAGLLCYFEHDELDVLLCKAEAEASYNLENNLSGFFSL